MTKYKRNKRYIKLIELTPLLKAYGRVFMMLGFIGIGSN